MRKTPAVLGSASGFHCGLRQSRPLPDSGQEALWQLSLRPSAHPPASGEQRVTHGSGARTWSRGSAEQQPQLRVRTADYGYIREAGPGGRSEVLDPQGGPPDASGTALSPGSAGLPSSRAWEAVEPSLASERWTRVQRSARHEAWTLTEAMADGTDPDRYLSP